MLAAGKGKLLHGWNAWDDAPPNPRSASFNGFHIKVWLKERDIQATVHEPLVALHASLACGLFLELRVLTCGCRFDAAGWQLQPSLGSPLPQALPQAQGRNRLGTGFQPISKSCQIIGKALWRTQAFATMPLKGVFPTPLKRADVHFWVYRH